MRRLLLLFPLFLLIFSGTVCALTPQEAMMQALKTGNYSIVEPYLSPLMKAAFTRGEFRAIREGLIRGHGAITGYELLRVKTEGPYRVYYYRVIAEKGDYTVTVTVRDGRVEGFHLKGFSITLTPAVLYPLAGAIAALLLIWLYLKRFGAAEVLFGLAIFLIAIAVQSPLQSLPAYLGVAGSLGTILWGGFVAGLIQEGVKYYSARGKNLRDAIYIGSGFGLTEALYIGFLTLLLGSASLLSALERFLALLFHSSTAGLFSYSHARGWGKRAFLLAFLVHWAADSMALYWQYTPSTWILVVTYTILGIASLPLLKLLPQAKAERERRVRW